MKKIQGIELSSESNEELLPDFFVDFPYIATCAEFDEYIDPVVPWHWHQAVELFYIKSGRMEYTTPNGKCNKDTDEKMKAMMCYIQEHYAETISVNQLSEMAHISKRVCFRLFREKLHMSPLEYITEYRLRKACMKLINTEDSITEIANDCGFGTGSYLGKIFREHFNCSPKQYRKEWHDRDINSHK